MRTRHPIPRLWLMTDERMGDALWGALDRLPRGAGVVFRHHSLSPDDRRRLLARVEAVGRRRGLVVLGTDCAASGGTHNGVRRRGLNSRSVHDRREAVAALRARVDLVFVSPVFATRSHPGVRVLGRRGVAQLVRSLPIPAIALGGMDAWRFQGLRGLGIYGWAAIDAWLEPSRPGQLRGTAARRAPRRASAG